MMKKVTLVLLAIFSRSHGTTYKASEQTNAIKNALEPKFGGFTSDLAGVISKIVGFDLTEASERKKEAKNNYDKVFKNHFSIIKEIMKNPEKTLRNNEELIKMNKKLNKTFKELTMAKRNYWNIFFQYEKKRTVVRTWPELGLYLKAMGDYRKKWDKYQEVRKLDKEKAKDKDREKALNKLCKMRNKLKIKYTEYEKSKNFPDCPEYKKYLQDLYLLDESNLQKSSGDSCAK